MDMSTYLHGDVRYGQSFRPNKAQDVHNFSITPRTPSALNSHLFPNKIEKSTLLLDLRSKVTRIWGDLLNFQRMTG